MQCHSRADQAFAVALPFASDCLNSSGPASTCAIADRIYRRHGPPVFLIPHLQQRSFMIKKMIKRTCLGAATATLILVPLSLGSFAADLKTIELPGERAYPESISAASDGTLYVSSLASGGVSRIKPGATKAEEWIKPGAFDSRTTFGVLVDEKTGVLWVCSNDISAIGVPGPGSATGSHLKSFD